MGSMHVTCLHFISNDHISDGSIAEKETALLLYGIWAGSATIFIID